MKLFHARFAQTLGGGNVVLHEDDFYLPDTQSVRRQLRAKGYWPLAIYEQKPPLFEWMDVRSRAWQSQLLRALRFQTGTTSAGTALLNIIEGEQDRRRRIAFLPTRTVLKGGGSFSEALRELRLLDAATMAIITAGERAGDLKGVILHAIEHVEEKGKQFRAMKAALGWFSFDIISTVGSIWGTQFGIIPHIKREGTKSTDAEAIAKFTRGIEIATWSNSILLGLSTILILVSTFFAISYWINRHKPEHFTSRLMMKTPVFASYLRNVNLQDTCKLMARLLQGKVPLADALEIIVQSSMEPATRGYWRDSLARVMGGSDSARALAREPLLKAERDQILTIQSIDQLAEVYQGIAEERGIMASADKRRLVMLSIFILLLLGGGTILITIYLLMLQNQSLLDNMQQLRQ